MSHICICPYAHFKRDSFHAFQFGLTRTTLIESSLIRIAIFRDNECMIVCVSEFSEFVLMSSGRRRVTFQFFKFFLNSLKLNMNIPQYFEHYFFYEIYVFRKHLFSPLVLDWSSWKWIDYHLSCFICIILLRQRDCVLFISIQTSKNLEIANAAFVTDLQTQRRT